MVTFRLSYINNYQLYNVIQFQKENYIFLQKIEINIHIIITYDSFLELCNIM